MSETEKIQEIENNAQPSPPSKKTTPSKRLSSFERARVEGEELLKALGVEGTLEGKRRTRSSTRGPAPPAAPSPPQKRARASTPRKSKKAKQEEKDNEVEKEEEKAQPTQQEDIKAVEHIENSCDVDEKMETDATCETKSNIEQSKDDKQETAVSKPAPAPVAAVKPTISVQPPVIFHAPVETKSTVIQLSPDVLPTVVIQPSNENKPTLVIEPSSPPADIVDGNTNDSSNMEIDEKPDEPSVQNSGTSSVNENRLDSEKNSPEPVNKPDPEPMEIIPAPSSVEAKINVPNAQEVYPATAKTVNNVQPSESVPVTEENIQKIQKPVVDESEPDSGYTTLIQVMAPLETQTVPNDLTTTASNGSDVFNNVPPLNNEETLKILEQSLTEPLSQVL